MNDLAFARHRIWYAREALQISEDRQDRHVLRVTALSLRAVAPERPMVVRTIGEVTIVGLASAWGAWCGRDAELPAVEAAIESLARAALDSVVDWPAALVAAFAAASRAIEKLPGGEPRDDESPTCSLVCAVLTPDEVMLAWLGKTVACLVTPCGVARELAAHMWRNKLRRELPAEEFAKVTVPRHMLESIVRQVGAGEPEVARWPALAAGEQLLLVDRGKVDKLRAALPVPAERDAWLRAVLECGDDEAGQWPVDPVGVLVEVSRAG